MLLLFILIYRGQYDILILIKINKTFKAPFNNTMIYYVYGELIIKFEYNIILFFSNHLLKKK